MDVWTLANTITQNLSCQVPEDHVTNYIFTHISCNSYSLQEELYSCKCAQQTQMSWISALNCSETAFHLTLRSYHRYQYVWHIIQWFSEADRFRGYMLQEFIRTVSNLFWIIMKKYDHFCKYSFYFQMMWGLLMTEWESFCQTSAHARYIFTLNCS